MNNRRQTIDNFLKFFANIASQNPTHVFSRNEIYHELTRIGVPSYERNFKTSNLFNNWIQYYQNNPNCNVFVSEDWKYFCQFISTDRAAYYSNQHMKIYVPLKSTHIENGAKEIFNFLSNNNISHASKIGSDIRCDNIVIRLININDFSKLINFLNNNNYIQEGLLPANPFLFNINGIPVASDGTISFNATISHLIALYINNKTSTNELNTVNVDDFYLFVENYYKYSFSSKTGIYSLMSQFQIDSSMLVDYKNVFELILKSKDPNFRINDYIAHYQECSNPNIQNNKENDIINLINGSNQNTNEYIEQKTNETFLYIFDVMFKKYPNEDLVLNAINFYLIYGDLTKLTRENNLRDDIANSTFRQDLNNILLSKNIDFKEYAKKLLEQRKQLNQNNNPQAIVYDKDKFVLETIKKILITMSYKYDKVTAIQNLINYVKTGKSSFLTRFNNLRDEIDNSTFRQDLQEILTKLNITIEDYINTIVDIGSFSQGGNISNNTIKI